MGVHDAFADRSVLAARSDAPVLNLNVFQYDGWMVSVLLDVVRIETVGSQISTDVDQPVGCGQHRSFEKLGVVQSVGFVEITEPFRFGIEP